MPNRYFIADPRVTGPAQFLAGFGQRRQQVADANVATQAQQNRLFGQGMGDVVGGFFEQQTADRRFNMQQQAHAQRVAQAQANRLAAQQAYNQGQITLENVRSANDIYEYERQAFIETWGAPPEAVFEQMMPGPASGQPGPQGAPAEGQPSRTYQPADPSQLQEYRRLEGLVQSYSKAAQSAMELPSLREREEQLMQILPALARAQRQLRGMERKPQTAQQEFDSGYATRDGIGYRPNGKGGWDALVLPKAVTEAAPWASIPDPVARQKAQDQHFATHHRVEADGSEWIFQGGQWEKVKPDKDDTKAPGELYDEAFKLLSAGKEVPANYEDVVSYMADRERFAEEQERKPAHDALVRRANDLLRMSARGQVYPATLVEWAKDAAATYGGLNITQWPKDMQDMARKLDAEYDRLTRPLIEAEWESVSPGG